MEEALDIEVAAFGIDIDKIEAAIKQHLTVTNDQLKKACWIDIINITHTKIIFSSRMSVKRK